MSGRPFPTQKDWYEHLEKDPKIAHGIWKFVRDYVPGFGYSKKEIDDFFEGQTAGGKKKVDWASLTSKPGTYPPSAHTLASHSSKAHSELSDAPADAHHPQSHTLASHSSKAHSELTGVLENQHHAKLHTLASHSTKPHSALTNVLADQHHAQVHNFGSHGDLNLGSLEEGETIRYDQATTKWIDAWGVEYDNPRLVWKMYTDFFSRADDSNDPWDGAGFGGGGCVAVAGTNNHPGIVRLSSDLTDAGYRFMTATNCIRIAGAEHSEFCFKTGASLINFRARLGFQDSLTATIPTDGIWINISGTTLSGKTRNNGAESTTGTSYPIAASTWYRAKIAVNSDATEVIFILYSEAGVVLWTNTLAANIPTAAGRETGHGVVMWVAADVARTFDVDMMIATRAGYITR